MKHRFNKNSPLLSVDFPKTGRLYHVAWASRGVTGRCTQVNEDDKTVLLTRPKTKEPFARPVAWADLRHTRKDQVKKQKQS